MNTEQERADFEAWAQNSFELHRHSAGEYSSPFTQTAWAAWQARAALQSQDREDAERFRWLRDKSRVFKQDPDMSGNHYWMVRINGALRGATLDEAIDAAIAAEKMES